MNIATTKNQNKNNQLSSLFVIKIDYDLLAESNRKHNEFFNKESLKKKYRLDLMLTNNH